MGRQFRDDEEARSALKEAIDGWKANPSMFDEPEAAEAAPETRTIEAFGDPAPEPEAAPAQLPPRIVKVPLSFGNQAKPAAEAPKQDDELRALQAFAERRRRSAALGQAGSNFADAFTTPSARVGGNFWEKYGEEGNQAVADLKARRGEAERLEKKAKADAEDKADSDPMSERSEFARSMVKRFAPSLDVEGLSAKDIKQFAPWVTAGINKREPAAPKPVDPLDAERKQLELERLRKSLEAKPVDPLDADKKQAEIDRIKATTDKLKRPPAVKADNSAEKATAATNKAVTELRREFNNLPEVKNFKDVEASFGKVKRAAQSPSAAGDLNLIFGYMRMLDPGSSVKEGEFANAENAKGVDESIRAKYNKLVSGERLTEGQRADFIGQAQGLYDVHAKQFRSAADRYRALGKKAGGEADDVAIDLVDLVDPGAGRKAPPAGGFDLGAQTKPAPEPGWTRGTVKGRPGWISPDKTEFEAD